MKRAQPQHELYHEIFGSILDRTEMAPYLLLRSADYRMALRQATRMMGNRGFDTLGRDDLRPGEKARAASYIRQVDRYLSEWLLPFVDRQLAELAALKSSNRAIYAGCRRALAKLRSVLADEELRRLVTEDPRHLFLLASSRKYPTLFHGYRGRKIVVPGAWQRMACAMLKMGHIIKSIEEDSQDIHDYAQLGLFLESHGQDLDELFNFNWERPDILPDDEAAERAFVKVSTFFHKLKESMTFDPARPAWSSTAATASRSTSSRSRPGSRARKACSPSWARPWKARRTTSATSSPSRSCSRAARTR